MSTQITKPRGLLSLAGLAVGLLFLLACTTQPTPTSGAVTIPTGSQVGLTDASGMARTVGYGEVMGNGIHVTGTGQANGTPDLATLNLGVEAFAGTVQEARDDAAAAMDQVLNVLRDQGIPEEDIRTAYFNISPRYSSREVTHCVDGAEMRSEGPDSGETPIKPDQECYQDRESVITGYQVTNQLRVKVRDLDNVGNIIDAVTAAAGNLIRLQGVNFSIEDTQELQRQAREAAVADLQNKAEQLADFSGVELGAIVFLREGGGQAPMIVEQERAAFDGAAAASIPTQILAGEISVTVTVQGVYAIQ